MPSAKTLTVSWQWLPQPLHCTVLTFWLNASSSASVRTVLWAFSPARLLPYKRCAVSAHQARNVGADDVDAHLFFKGAEDSFIIESTALHDDVAAQLFRAGRADDLVQRVLDDGNRQIRR